MKSFAMSVMGLVVCGSCLLSPGNAQVVTATLVGKVTDQSNAVTPGVTIKIENQTTGLTRMVVTDQGGDYMATALPAGIYRVTAELAGFKQAVISDIALQVAQTERVDIVLNVGAATERVEVVADVP